MADTIHFELVSPGRLVTSQAVGMSVVPGADGDFGAMPGHAPMLSTVRAGVIVLFTGGKPTKRLFVAGGFAEVTADRCTVLAEEAFPLDEVTPDAVARRLQDADDRLREAVTPAEKAKAEHAKSVAEALKAALQAGDHNNDPRYS